ncbi:hypothetical protein GCM10010236_74870 [Streptomyces eurythermus]|nr:hypothetical protein GCM10010236_74870 [Streptomyces eurythermus]
MRLIRKIVTSTATIAVVTAIGLAAAPSAMASDGNATLPNGNLSFVPAVSASNCTQSTLNGLMARSSAIAEASDRLDRYIALTQNENSIREALAERNALELQYWALNLHMRAFVDGCRAAMHPIG